MFDWTPRFLRVDRIKLDENLKPTSEEVLCCEGFPPAGESFIDLLDHQIRKVGKTKVDTGVSSPCKAYSFLENEKGEVDRGWLEEDFLQSETLEDFEQNSDMTLHLLKGLPSLSEGLLVQAKVAASFEDASMDLVFVTLMKYLPTERLLFGDEIDLEEVHEVVHRDPSQAFFYPHGTPDALRMDLIKILSKPATDPWVGMLAVEPPPSTERLLQDEVARHTQELDPEGWDGRRELFRRIPPKKRDLFSSERLVPEKATMDDASAAAVARRAERTTRDLYGKSQVLNLMVGNAKVQLPLEGLGEHFSFAREGGDEYLVLRCKQIQTQKGGLTPADFLAPGTLLQVCERMVEE
jgi:hypothetical protein